MVNKALIALSGGMDSATLLGVLLHEGKDVHCIIFRYPSKHNEHEIKSAIALVEYYKNLTFSVHYRIFDLTSVFTMFDSNLLMQGDAIPEGHYANENMKLTVVPGRNAIFTTIMAGYAESKGIGAIYLGVHSGDHAIYPDCRPDFIQSIGETVKLSSGGTVEVFAPFLVDDKASILEQGYSLKFPVPYELTRTCYKDQKLSCGKCGSCNERLEAFSLINKVDPIEYE